jgi:CheY-like chemotaxis protein
LIKQTVGPAIDVALDLIEDCWPVNCDPNQLENALLNLAINARDAMLPGGGKLVIKTQHVALDAAGLAGWDTAKAGDYVKISLIDTGAGMPSDVLSHAFEPFYTTKPAGQGTGLGLSQVFGFVSQSNGMINIESEVGAGTAVHLFLPRALGVSEQQRIPVTGEKEIRYLSGLTVLLVEDEDNIRDLAVEILREIGCNVIEASDGSSALHVLRMRARDSGIDMLITDVGLPGGLNGRQLADAARELYPLVPVLLITGYAGEALGKGIAPGNRMELLTKPFTLDALAARVETMLLPN